MTFCFLFILPFRVCLPLISTQLTLHTNSSGIHEQGIIRANSPESQRETVSHWGLQELLFNFSLNVKQVLKKHL